MLYKDTKEKVRSPEGDTDFLDIVADVLQGDTWAPNLFIICLDWYFEKGNKQMILRINYYGLSRLRWRSASGKRTYLGRIPTA